MARAEGESRRREPKASNTNAELIVRLLKMDVGLLTAGTWRFMRILFLGTGLLETLGLGF